MITIYVKDFNEEITQESYDNIINNLDLNTIKCSCGHYGVTVHGYYDRRVKTVFGSIRLVVMRVKCQTCGKTHAILLSSIVPYQSIQLKDQLRIIMNNNLKELMESNLDIDESNISTVRYNYHHYFKQRLISENIELDSDVVTNCFDLFKRQFLQIKCQTNILYT